MDLLFGRWLALGYVVVAVAFCVTVIGIPFGVAGFGLVPVFLTPLGRDVVPADS